MHYSLDLARFGTFPVGMIVASQREAAEGLAERIREDKLDPAALEHVTHDHSQRLCVGVSGGLDSVSALLLLWAHRPELRERLLILHFNHGLRGRASDLDQKWVERLGGELRLEVRCGRWHAPSESEGEARTARLRFFADMCRRHAARCVLLGHHADDVAETLLQRMARGSGIEGLSGPRPVQRLHAHGIDLVRPLLGLGRTELAAAARSAGVKWREDRSNQGRHYERNRLRLDVLPAVDAAVGRRFAAGAAVARAQLDAEREALDWSAERLFREMAAAGDISPGHMRLPGNGSLPEALRERVLLRWLQQNSSNAYRFVEPILRSNAGGVWRLDKDLDVERVGDLLAVRRGSSEPIWSGRCVRPGGRLDGLDGALLESDWVSAAEVRRVRKVEEFVGSVLVRPEAIGSFLRVRTRQMGDRYQPFGAYQLVRIQDMFVNRKIPEHLRDALPVIESEFGRILWVAGLPPAEEVRVQRADEAAVQLTYRPPRAL